MSKKGMLFVQGQDCPGIIQTVTGILFKSGANLEDLSMTLLEGQFAMMVSFQSGSAAWKKIKSATLMLGKKPWNLYTDLIVIQTRKKKISSYEKSILITAIGKDRTGIVFRLSSDLAAIAANITNLDCRLIQGARGRKLYSLALGVDLKFAADQKKIPGLIKRWKNKMGIEVKLHTAESAVF